MDAGARDTLGPRPAMRSRQPAFIATVLTLLTACQGGLDHPPHEHGVGDAEVHGDGHVGLDFDGGPEIPFDGPMLLSETGLYSDIATRTLAPGDAPFDVGFELWSDGAEKQRWLLLPEGTAIDDSDVDRWSFPTG